MTLDDAIAACPIVAILRGVTPEEAVDHGEALYDAGVRAMEVPLNSPDPLVSIARLVEAFRGRMSTGAGTVLTIRDAEAVAAAGGRFAVAPNTDPTVIARLRAMGLEPAPGFATATEAFAALNAGARHLKLFPAATYGPGHLRQLAAVLPEEARVWAVGGVGAGDLTAWRAAGATAFGIGSEVYRPGQAASETGVRAAALVAACVGLSPPH
jgi:2-dehydro-3-deoxyphosphogalactonate aldolase